MIQLWMWEYEGKIEYGERFYRGDDEFCRTFNNKERYRLLVTHLRKAKVVDEDAVTKTYLTTDQFIKVWKSLDEPKQKELHAARETAWYATWETARNAAWDAARNAAWDAARNAAWDAARNAAWYAARNAAWDAARDAAWDAARDAAWYAARNADRAILVKDKISDEQFNLLTSPWTSCGLSLYAEDWDEVLNPPITEPKNFGAIVEAEYADEPRTKWIRIRTATGTAWQSAEDTATWQYLITPTIISEGVE